MALELPPLYAILDPEHTRGRPAERVLIDLLEAGVSILQLRVKSLSPVDFLELAKGAKTAFIPQCGLAYIPESSLPAKRRIRFLPARRGNRK